ncbi:hypothetical protein M3592_27920 [Priestia aryabhattai]|uniref:hypothetical protein n=1 Tax=Priestia TaxID=2800373 RepID=UPI0012B6D742|nr:MULTISPECIES: hypothetical protein [Priestia]MCM2979209.1 hypothetical protein [Priestia aryabhattai]
MLKSFLVTSVLMFFIIGCQQTNGEALPGSNQLDQVKGIQLSKFEDLGSLNENYRENFADQSQLEVFQNALTNAKRENESIKKYDYDIKLNFKNGENKALHIAKNKKDELILKYIGDSNATYVVSNDKARDLIKLIY